MSTAVLLYHWELNVIVPVLGPMMATAMVYCYLRQGQFIERGGGHLLRPLITGLKLGAFGFLLLSTVYILPELRLEFAFYPRPWISTLLLGMLLLYLGSQIWPQLGIGINTTAITVFYATLVVIIVAAWAIPGLLLSLIVIILGASSGNRIFVGSGIAFMVLFIATYFYGIQLTMLTKSITLVCTGIAVLAVRWLLLRVLPNQEEWG